MTDICITADSCGCGCSSDIPNKEELISVIDELKDIPGALITVLHRAQGMYGYLPKEVLYEISGGLKVPISEVMGIVTFYSFFSTVPKGKYDIMVCMGTACYVRGAERVLDKFADDLGVEMGGTTDDKLFSLTHSRCIGACGLAPVVSVNGEIHREVTVDDVPGIITEYRERKDN
jgi:NADH:ubiquinone oxidoreductase subunit E